MITQQIISQMVSTVSTSGTWGTAPWTAPRKGFVVGIQLSTSLNLTGGAGADVSIYAGVFQFAPTGGGTSTPIGLAPAAPSPVYAFINLTGKEVAASTAALAQAIFVPVRIPMVAGQQIHFAILASSTVNTGLGSAVIQFSYS